MNINEIMDYVRTLNHEERKALVKTAPIIYLRGVHN